jgi:hypothetical protein
MKYNKKDKPKVIVLFLVLIALWAFIGIYFAVLSKREEAKKAAAEVRRQAAAQALQVAQQTTGQSAMSPSSRLAALVAPVEPPKDDPFRPVIAPRTSGPRTSQGSQSRPKPILPPPPDATGYRSSNLHLTGVIIGNPSTAVLRVGDEHYIVREGDWLDSQLRVHEISQEGVTLRDARSTYKLRLGR